jgi:hypothetical protein
MAAAGGWWLGYDKHRARQGAANRGFGRRPPVPCASAGVRVAAQVGVGAIGFVACGGGISARQLSGLG